MDVPWYHRLKPVADKDVGAKPAQFLFVFIFKKAIFEDDFHECPAAVADFYDRANVGGDIAPFFAQHLADVDDHVQLSGAVCNRLLGLSNLDRGKVATMR